MANAPKKNKDPKSTYAKTRKKGACKKTYKSSGASKKAGKKGEISTKNPYGKERKSVAGGKRVDGSHGRKSLKG